MSDQKAGRPPTVRAAADVPPYDVREWLPSMIVQTIPEAVDFWLVHVQPRAARGEIHPDARPMYEMAALCHAALVCSFRVAKSADPQLLRQFRSFMDDCGFTPASVDRAAALRKARADAQPKEQDPGAAAMALLAGSQQRGTVSPIRGRKPA
jgi:hypothetical protein